MKLYFQKSIFLFALVLVSLFTLTACDGYVKGARMDSYTSPENGWYEGEFSAAGGTYTNRFETPASLPGYEVDVEFSVAIESGEMTVSLVMPDESRISETVTPTNPVTLSGRSSIKTDAQIYYIPLVFEVAGEGEVTGISYKLTYQVP